MKGLHCMADLQGCSGELLCEPHRTLAFAKALIAQHGLHAVAEQLHVFPANPTHVLTQGEKTEQGGYTLTVLLAESHLCIHTWPELLGVTLDVYVCNIGSDNSQRARGLCADLTALFAPSSVQQREVQRGA